MQPFDDARRAFIDGHNPNHGKGGFIEAGLEWPALRRPLERIDGTEYRV